MSASGLPVALHEFLIAPASLLVAFLHEVPMRQTFHVEDGAGEPAAA